jgi:hypothetical protein
VGLRAYDLATAHATRAPRNGRSEFIRRAIGSLASPELRIELRQVVVRMDVELARFIVLGPAGSDGTQHRAAGESHFNVIREAIETAINPLAFGR